MKILSFIVSMVGMALIIRAGQIHRDVAKAAGARKALLSHYVDHTVVLTKRELEEQQFWSNYRDHSERAFHWTFLGGMAAFAIVSLLEKYGVRANRHQEAQE